MALKNTLLLCSMIVAGGAIAGVSMKPHSYFPQSYDASSGGYGTYGGNAPQASPESSYGSPSYGEQPSDAASPGDPSQQQYGSPQGYGSPSGYGPPQRYGQASPSQSQQPYGPPPSYGPQQDHGGAGAYAPQQGAPNDPQLVSLTQIDQADRILPRMPVESANGQRIGEVAQVMMEHGRAREVLLDQGTRIPASDLMYSPTRSVLVAQASPNGASSGYGRNGYGPSNAPQQSGPAYGPPEQRPPGY